MPQQDFTQALHCPLSPPAPWWLCCAVGSTRCAGHAELHTSWSFHRSSGQHATDLEKQCMRNLMLIVRITKQSNYNVLIRDYKFQYVQYNTELHNCIMHCITYFGNYRPTQSLPKCKYHLETCWRHLVRGHHTGHTNQIYVSRKGKLSQEMKWQSARWTLGHLFHFINFGTIHFWVIMWILNHNHLYQTNTEHPLIFIWTPVY